MAFHKSPHENTGCTGIIRYRESFNHSIFKVVCEELKQKNDEVQTLDLYKDDFDPE